MVSLLFRPFQDITGRQLFQQGDGAPYSLVSRAL
jgi:hypothetical protein